MIEERGPQLSEEAFRVFREMIASMAGVSLGADKRELVMERIGRRLRKLKLRSYEEYLEKVHRDRDELSNMVDALTTNLTSFFREAAHFDFIRERLIPEWREKGQPIQIWSAGCSSGEEPYSLAMLLRDALPDVSTRILATDLSLRILAQAQTARYSPQSVSGIPPELRARFVRQGDKDDYTLTREITQMVSFARLNLMGDWSMRSQFSLILCRNVMIYFTDETRAQLACRFAERLAPGAPLFIGHAESLFGLKHPLRQIDRAVYAL